MHPKAPETGKHVQPLGGIQKIFRPCNNPMKKGHLRRGLEFDTIEAQKAVHR